MSMLFIEGLWVTCPDCGSVRKIPMRGGAAVLQVGDANVMHQMHIQKDVPPGSPCLFHLDAWCGACAAPLLASEAQVLADTRNRLLERISAWLDTLRQACRERLLAETRSGLEAESAGPWLRGTFPILFKECFENGLCGLYPDHFKKAKKRFRTQAGRALERDGLPLPAGFKGWLASQVAANPFGAELSDLAAHVLELDFASPGPWMIVESLDPWEGVNLNPYIMGEHTLFFAAGAPGTPLHFVMEETPSDFTSACERALRHPLDNGTKFMEELDFKAVLRKEVETRVDHLTWPIT